ncbi:hypothetical protein KSS87_011023 [Heliosperma pusillum]|nr:hypothetical protein KSS87_011023 [Heliosperma pusillum]
MSCWNIAQMGVFKSFESSSSLSREDSNSSNSSLSSSSSSLDYMEDASSSSSSSNGPLFHLSDLIDQLPIKKGLSKYYQGKSESFASLASVENLEDLPKRENPYKKRMKYCKSFCVGLDVERLTSPKATISKKSKGSSFSSLTVRRNCSSNFMAACRLPPVPLHKDF